MVSNIHAKAMRKICESLSKAMKIPRSTRLAVIDLLKTAIKKAKGVNPWLYQEILDMRNTKRDAFRIGRRTHLIYWRRHKLDTPMRCPNEMHLLPQKLASF